MSFMHTGLIAGGTLLLLASVSLAEDVENEERIIEHQLDSSESRVLRQSERPLERQQLQRDLGAAEQRLQEFKTQHPNAAATPPLERQLDRVQRQPRIHQPGPPTLLDQPPTLLERR